MRIRELQCPLQSRQAYPCDGEDGSKGATESDGEWRSEKDEGEEVTRGGRKRQAGRDKKKGGRWIEE